VSLVLTLTRKCQYDTFIEEYETNSRSSRDSQAQRFTQVGYATVHKLLNRRGVTRGSDAINRAGIVDLGVFSCLVSHVPVPALARRLECSP
jgi:hypothetical protein